ncbi:MAG: hypothetical protein QOI11_1764 [Candidatus Eremiobacteraeota bacterium]|jgi:hypothetical protein|nr:hypothetical protein [Candidatus Eremiobacteraeota bacterium]
MNLRNLRRRSGVLLGAALLCAATFQVVGAQAQHQNILLTTSDPAVLDKVLAAVKGDDNGRYSFDGTVIDRGRTRHVTSGALPLTTIRQMSASTLGGKIGRGGALHTMITTFFKVAAYERIREALAGVDTRLYALKEVPAPKLSKFKQ